MRFFPVDRTQGSGWMYLVTHAPCFWTVPNSFPPREEHLWWGTPGPFQQIETWDSLRAVWWSLCPWRTRLTWMQFGLIPGATDPVVKGRDGDCWMTGNSINYGDGWGTPAWAVKAHVRSLQPPWTETQDKVRMWLLTQNATAKVLPSCKEYLENKEEKSTNTAGPQTKHRTKNRGLCMNFFAL